MDIACPRFLHDDGKFYLFRSGIEPTNLYSKSYLLCRCIKSRYYVLCEYDPDNLKILTVMIVYYIRAMLPLAILKHLLMILTGLILAQIRLMYSIVKPHVSDSHAVLGEGSSFIRANCRCRSQCLHCLKIFNQTILCSHTFCSKC